MESMKKGWCLPLTDRRALCVGGWLGLLSVFEYWGAFAACMPAMRVWNEVSLMGKIWRAAFVAVLCFAVLVAAMGGKFFMYLDFASLFVVVVFPLLYQCALFGMKGVRTAFAVSFGKNGDEHLAFSLNFFSTYGRATWLFAILASGMSVVEVLSNLTDFRRMGLYIAITLFCLLYAAMINLVLICPCAAGLRMRIDGCLREASEENAQAGYVGAPHMYKATP